MQKRGIKLATGRAVAAARIDTDVCVNLAATLPCLLTGCVKVASVTSALDYLSHITCQNRSD